MCLSLARQLALRRRLVAQVRAKRPAAESVGEEEDFRSQLNSEIEVQGHHTTKQRLIKTRCPDRPKAVFLKNNWIRSSLPLFFQLPRQKNVGGSRTCEAKKSFLLLNVCLRKVSVLPYKERRGGSPLISEVETLFFSTCEEVSSFTFSLSLSRFLHLLLALLPFFKAILGFIHH